MIFGFYFLMETKEDILRDVLISAETHCVLKIKVKSIPNPVITAVEKVRKDHVKLMPTCLYGYKLKKRNITLPEIESVTRHKTNFHHPIFQKLRFIKNNISELRNNFEAYRQEPSGILRT